MIKLSVNPSVEAALKIAFPKPPAAAKRALAKYISVVESMLFDALQRGQTPEQRKLGLYAISLDQLANKGGQIGPNKIRVHKWLNDNQLDIVQTVVKGTKFSGRYSQIKLSPLVVVQNSLKVQSEALAGAKTDDEIDAYLCGDVASNIALFDHLYPELKSDCKDDKSRDLFDLMPVDIESVKAYVYWLEMESKLIQGTKKDLAIRQARTILGVASVKKGYYLQRKKASSFGRTYYEGTSVQNINKELRRAVLGNCWEYDIRSSAVAWKMGFARKYLAANGQSQDLKKAFPATLLYLEDKKDFMATVRHFVFLETSSVPKGLQMNLLKKAFSAISFGARKKTKGWVNARGKWTNPALVEIFKNKEDRARFLADPTVQKFLEEQSRLDDYLFAEFKNNQRDLLKDTSLQSPSGRPSKAKILAYLYQHAETEIMDLVCSVAKKYGHEPIARVHDAIFFKRRLGVDVKNECELIMREFSKNPFWSLTAKQLDRYEPRKSLDAELEEKAHRARIQAEEARAKQYFSTFSMCAETKIAANDKIRINL